MNDDHTHTHGEHHRGPPQPDHPEPRSHYQIMGVALNELLIEKGVYTAGELRDMIATIEAVEPATHGARVVARAWADDEFRTRLLTNAYDAVASLGLEPGYAELTVLENTQNTPNVHNVVVCTLCSCYPRTLLGRPPSWYKSASYRSRLVREPRAVLTEFGTVLPDGVEVRVHDSTADLRYIVLPIRPAGTDEWPEEELSKLATRDSMIGVSQASRP